MVKGEPSVSQSGGDGGPRSGDEGEEGPAPSGDERPASAEGRPPSEPETPAGPTSRDPALSSTTPEGAAPPGSDEAPTQYFQPTSEPAATDSVSSASSPPASATPEPGSGAVTSLAPSTEHPISTARSPITDHPPEAAVLSERGERIEEASRSMLASAFRSIFVCALLGWGLVMWAQLTFDSEWVTKFLVHNKLEMSQRMTLIYTSLGGAVAGAVVAAGVLLFAWRKKHPIAAIERFVWFISPMAFAPLLPLLFRYKPWVDRRHRLLFVMMFIVLIAEIVAFRSFKSTPESVTRAIAWLREKIPIFVKKHGPWIIVILGALFYACFFSFFALRWHWKLKTSVFDLAINDNLMYGGLVGQFFQSPVVFPENPGRYFGAHAKIGGYAFLPLYALYPRAETLIVLQSSLLGFTAIPLFAFAKRWVSNWMAVLIAVCFLCYHPMHAANFHEVKYVPIATFFVMSVIYAADAKRWVLLVLAFIPGVLMREDMPIGFATIGLVLLLSGHRPKVGLVMAALSITWFVVLRFGLMPLAGSWWFPKMYKDLWAPGEKGFGSVVKTLLSNQLFVFTTMQSERKLIYLQHILVPLAFLPLRRPWLWAAFIPGFIMTLLTTDYKPTITYSFQYVMHWTPYVFVAVPLALASIERQTKDHAKTRAHAALAAMVFTTAVLSFNYGAYGMREGFKGGFVHIKFDYTDEERKRYAALRELIDQIPEDASVAATEKVGPHVSNRKTMHSMRKGPNGADYILAGRREIKLEKTRPTFKDALRKQTYGVVDRKLDFVLLKRGHDPARNKKLLRDWRL